jgi:hypothetical protein
MTDGIQAPLVGGGQREPIPFTITSEQSCDASCQSHGGVAGLARIDMPPWRTLTPPGQASQSFFLGFGDGIETPQIANSKLSGYATVQKGTCTSASLGSVTALRSIVVNYRCKRGQQFTVTYSPRIDYFGFNNTGSDSWTFGLSHTNAPGEPWTPLNSIRGSKSSQSPALPWP